MKVITMTDFVIQQRNDMKKRDDEQFSETLTRRAKLIESIFNYANFLKQPLELWMFVPCDEEGIVPNPMENKGDYELELYYHTGVMYNQFDEENYNKDLYQYQKAQERVLFEGFKVRDINAHSIWIKKDTTDVMFDLEGVLITKNQDTIEDMVYEQIFSDRIDKIIKDKL